MSPKWPAAKVNSCAFTCIASLLVNIALDVKAMLTKRTCAGGAGLSSWHTASEIVHAVASDPMDQFVKQDTVLKPWAHNAAPILSPNGCARHMSCRPRSHAISVSMTRSRSDGVRDMVQARMCSSARVCFAGRTSCFTLGLGMCTPRWLDQTDRGGRWRSTLTATTPPRHSTQTGLPLSCATTREAMSCESPAPPYDHAIPLLIAHIDYPLKVTPPYGWVLPDQRWS